MTICVATVAADRKAIVCVADNSVSYGEFITGEADASKIVRMPSGLTAMVSGDETDIERCLRKINRNSKLGASLPDLLDYCETEYLATHRELLDIRVLKPSLMDVKRLTDETIKPSPNKYVRELVKRSADFKIQCSIILCGFDKDGTAFIVSVDEPGVASDKSRLGYEAVGSGAEYSVMRLACWSDWKTTSPLDQSLYLTLDAKIAAEANPFIGSDWDAVVITKDGCTPVPKPIIELLDKAWVRYNRSPYWKREPDDLDDPPKDWKKQISTWTDSVMKSGPQT